MKFSVLLLNSSQCDQSGQLCARSDSSLRDRAPELILDSAQGRAAKLHTGGTGREYPHDCLCAFPTVGRNRTLPARASLFAASTVGSRSMLGMASTKRSAPLHRPPAAVRGVQRRDVDCPMAAGTTAAATLKWNSLGFVALAFDLSGVVDVSRCSRVRSNSLAGRRLTSGLGPTLTLRRR